VKEMVVDNLEAEKAIAAEADSVGRDGKHSIMAIGDAGWGKRSYNHTMSSNVGWVSVALFFICM